MKKIENHWAGVMERKQEAESATLTPSQFAVTVGNSFSFLSLDLFMQNELFPPTHNSGPLQK